MFHVKHSPIQETAPSFRTTLHQLVDLRIYDLNRQRVDQVRGRTVSFPIYLDLQTLPGQFHAGSTPAVIYRQFSEYRQALRPGQNQTRSLPATERPPPAEEENRFKNTGFTGAVRTDDDVVVRVRQKFD